MNRGGATSGQGDRLWGQEKYFIEFTINRRVTTTTTGFFFTPPAEKTKTQRQNSSKKLNLWEDFPSHVQNSRKKIKFIIKISSKLKIFKGVALFMPFLLTNIFKNRKI